MCGIAGIISTKSDNLVPKMEQMLTLMKRRGPDAQAQWQRENITLGHTRLSIIDLSEEANQPFKDTDNGNVLVFNGEIYNFTQLKRELEVSGIKFRTSSDTEVLLKGFGHWGMSELLRKVEGMFAFALYQPQYKKLFLARDRFGKKPLYYGFLGGDFIFSSDIRAVKKASSVQLEINYPVLDYYLNEYAIPQPHTIYKGVNQLEPASYKVIDVEEVEEIENEVYWNLESKIDESLQEKEALERTEFLLKDAVSKRMISDVPLGFFLSGGIDSSLTVSLAAEASSKRIQTFSVGFDDDYHNELPQAKQVAERFDTEHHEIFLKPDIAKMASNISRFTGEPFADYSLIPSAYISEAIKANATVAISGDGGDELFGGYKNYVGLYQANWLLKKYGKLAPIRIQASKLLSRIAPASFPNLGMSRKYMANQDSGFVTLRDSGFKSHLSRGQVFATDFDWVKNYTEDYFKQRWNQVGSNNDIHINQQLVSLTTLLLNDFLVKVDRSSMYNSLEVRSPFLDHKLAEFAFTIPHRLKFKNLHSKYLLKTIVREKIGRNVFKEPKRGFTVPMGRWLREDLSTWAESLLMDSLIKRQIFDCKFIVSIWNEHKSGKANYKDFLWMLIALELWFTECYDNT